MSRIPELVEDTETEVTDAMRALLFEVLAEVRDLEWHIAAIASEL